MGSSSRGSEGTDEVAIKIPEDLVLSWTRDATTNTFAEKDRQLLEELSHCVHKDKDASATKQKLSVLLGTGKDRKSVVIRARVLTRLIAIALGLHPDDITIDSETGKRSWRPTVNSPRRLIRLRLAEALPHDNTVLSYLFKDALEADDEVMTGIFCDPRSFEMYPVPYFHGCDLAVVQEISNLWLSQKFLRRFYYYTVLEPLFDQVKADRLTVRSTSRKQLQEKFQEIFRKVMMMLWELLQRRRVKAGARLLEVMLWFQNEETDPVLTLVTRLVIRLVRLKNGKFRKCFFGDFENSGGSDQETGGHGQSIIIGPSSAQTDSNLLCWAARRGYSNLIMCISQGYAEAYQVSPPKNVLEDAAEALKVSLLWKVALWCATRHGQHLVVMELTRPSWVKSIDFNDYTEIPRCLPPLHLVSLLGDRSLLRWLCIAEVGIEFGASKMDYLGKTPLDYAMQFQLTTKNSKEGMQFNIFTNDMKDKMQLEAYNKEYKEGMQYSPYDTRRQQYSSYDTRRQPYISYYGGRMQDDYYNTSRISMPIVGHQSCIQELLQMPGVVDRLKELNDMYTTQANFVLVGAALIASVTFAGWLQPPLGYIDYFQFTLPSPPAPTGTYEQYIAMEGHLNVQMFVVFNTLSFFLGIATMLIGAMATLFVHDDDERTKALMKVRKSIKWMLGFFITSMVCIMAAFICAGLAILPPIPRLEWSMIVSLCLGACICSIPLTWILFSLAKDRIVKVKDQMVKLIWQFNTEKKLDYFVKDLGGSLVNEKDIKTLQDEMERRFSEQPFIEATNPYSFKLYNDSDASSDDEYERIEHPPTEYLRRRRAVSFKKHGRRDIPPVVRINPTPTIQRRHSWA